MGTKEQETVDTISLISQKRSKGYWSRPSVFDLKKQESKGEFDELLRSGNVRSIHDEIKVALSELYDIHNPQKKDTKTPKEVEEFIDAVTHGDPTLYGVWVYYPWSGACVHFPPKEDLRMLRTSRNRNLITEAEQQRLYQSTLLTIGLSVGSSAVEMLLSQGIGGKLILVDMDIIEPTNLNRIKTTYGEVGLHKVDVIAKRISETDPFIEQLHIKDGLNEQNVEKILGNHRPDVIIDEMDDLRMKLMLREHAARHRLPVIMATDDGENAILDIERYDIDPKQLPFEGRIPDEIISKVLKGQLSRPELGMLIGKYFVGAEHIPLRMFESLGEVGKSIPSWPQLAGAATLSGVVLAYAAKKIILGQPLHGGRHVFDIDQELDPVVQTEAYKHKLKSIQKLFFA